MYKRITLAAFLIASGIASSHAAQPLFNETGAANMAAPANATASGAPFAGERKLRGARIGLHLNPGAASASELSLPLPDGRQFNAKRLRSYATASGSTVWVGKHTAATLGSAESASEETVLVVRNGKVTGTVRHEGKLYRIRAGADGSHGVGEIDTAKFPNDHAAGEYRPAATAPSPHTESSFAAVTPSLASTPVIRVMVHYTPSARNTTSDMAALIDLAIAETNQGYLNSGVNARVELAHSAPVNYSESGSNSTDRSRYADATTA